MWLLDKYAALRRYNEIMGAEMFVEYAFASGKDCAEKVLDGQISRVVYLNHQLSSFLYSVL
jgi:hypothetical protein